MQPKEFLNVIYALPEESFDFAYAALSDLPFLGATEGFDELIICFLNEEETPIHLEQFEQTLSEMNVDFTRKSEEIIVEKNWQEEWEQSIEPVIVNERIVIVPEWKKDELDAPLKIIISPKMSFGTGHHQTTRMMSVLLEKLVESDSFWIDAGTGTGILAILAVKLGSNRVFAFDNDEWSINNAEENIELNNVGDKIQVEQENVHTVVLPDCDGIAANLHRNLLESNFPRFFQALQAKNGDLVVSGILRFDVDEILDFARSAGFRLEETLLDGDWAAIHFSIDNAKRNS